MKEMQKLRFGIIGGGAGSFIADVHLKAARFDELGDLVCGCFSRDYEKSLAFGNSQGIEPDRIYRTFEEMAERESAREDGIDFVIVAAPNDVHYECCKAFLMRGIHVVCDKPLTHTSHQAEELKALAENQDLLFAVTYPYAAMPAAKFMKEQIRMGRIGKILLVKSEYLSDNLLASNEELGNGMLWRIDPAKAGPSTCCADIGVHAQNLISYVTGLSILELSADMNVIGENRSLDTNFTALCRYEDGVKGHIWCSNVAAGKYNDLRIEVYGTKGSLSWSLETPDIVVFGGQPAQRIYYRMGDGLNESAEAGAFRLPSGQSEGYYLAFANIYKAFMTALKDKKAGRNVSMNYPGAEEGIKSLRFVEACLESSSENGKWIKLK